MKELIDRNRALVIREGEIDFGFNETSYKTDVRLYGFGRTGKRIYTSDFGRNNVLATGRPNNDSCRESYFLLH